MRRFAALHHPAAVLGDQRDAADDAGARIARERLGDPLEVVRRQEQVAVELDHDVGLLAQLVAAALERAHDRRSARPLVRAVGRDDLVIQSWRSGVPLGDLARAVGRAVVDDDPLLRPVRLGDHRLGRAREVLGLVAHGRDDCVGR